MTSRNLTGIERYDAPAGVWGALKATAQAIADQMRIAEAPVLLFRTNKPDGFDCPGCAWPDKAHTSTFQFCENGAKAVTWEATKKRVTPAFFAAHTVTELLTWSDHDLEDAGRLTHPRRHAAGRQRADLPWRHLAPQRRPQGDRDDLQDRMRQGGLGRHPHGGILHRLRHADERPSEPVDQPPAGAGHQAAQYQYRQAPRAAGGLHALQEGFGADDVVQAVAVRHMLHRVQQHAQQHAAQSGGQAGEEDGEQKPPMRARWGVSRRFIHAWIGSCRGGGQRPAFGG